MNANRLSIELVQCSEDFFPQPYDTVYVLNDNGRVNSFAYAGGREYNGDSVVLLKSLVNPNTRIKVPLSDCYLAYTIGAR